MSSEIIVRPALEDITIRATELDRIPWTKAGMQQHLLSKLRLTIGEAARVTGISIRQLNYWTRKGLVRALGSPGRKRYDARALERIALIKRSLIDGYSLEEAAERASVIANEPSLDEETARSAILNRLSELEALVSNLRQSLSNAGHARLTASAEALLQLNLRTLFYERPSTRANPSELAAQLGLARDRVKLALDALVEEGMLIRQGRSYKRPRA